MNNYLKTSLLILRVDFVRLGEHSFASEIDCVTDRKTGKEICADPPVNVGVEKILIHPRYHKTAMQMMNDIALLRMSSFFASASDFPSSVGTICLPTEKFPNYETMTALGWGGTDADVSQSDLLKEASIHKFNFHFTRSRHFLLG